MTSVKGYFDGTVCIPLEEIPAEANRRVIITVLDEEAVPVGQDSSVAMKIFATLSPKEARAIREEPFRIKDC